MSNMYSGCGTLEEINFSQFNTNNVTNNVTNMCYMFNDCKSLKALNLSNFNPIM